MNLITVDCADRPRHQLMVWLQMRKCAILWQPFSMRHGNNLAVALLETRQNSISSDVVEVPPTPLDGSPKPPGPAWATVVMCREYWGNQSGSPVVVVVVFGGENYFPSRTKMQYDGESEVLLSPNYERRRISLHIAHRRHRPIRA